MATNSAPRSVSYAEKHLFRSSAGKSTIVCARRREKQRLRRRVFCWLLLSLERSRIWIFPAEIFSPQRQNIYRALKFDNLCCGLCSVCSRPGTAYWATQRRLVSRERLELE